MFNHVVLDQALHFSMKHFILEADNANDNSISFYSMGFKQHECYFPKTSLTEFTLKRLQKPVVLTTEEMERTFDMLKNSPCCPDLLRSLVALAYLGDVVEDLTHVNVSSLSRLSQHKLYSFVSFAGKDTLFYVLEHGNKANTYVCMEVHPSEPKALRKVLLHGRQIAPAKREGAFESLAQAKADFDKEIQSLIDDPEQ